MEALETCSLTRMVAGDNSISSSQEQDKKNVTLTTSLEYCTEGVC